MTSIRLIVSDIDGTLVDRSERIPPELVAAVQRCRDSGIVFALCTGRTTELAAPFVEALGVDAPCILGNGAFIRQGSACLAEHGFSVAPIRGILEEAESEGFTVTLADTETERALQETDYVRFHKGMGRRFQKPLPLTSIDWAHDRYQKVMIFDETRSGRINPMRTRLEAMQHLYWVTGYSNRAVEIGPPACNKATGVRELAKLLGVEMSEVMACGDFLNDLEMIREAGLGVAVENAAPEIKAAAKYVATKPFAPGVVEAMERFCFRDAQP